MLALWFVAVLLVPAAIAFGVGFWTRRAGLALAALCVLFTAAVAFAVTDRADADGHAQPWLTAVLAGIVFLPSLALGTCAALAGAALRRPPSNPAAL